MLIEISSDILCPFCYIGKRHLEAAPAQVPHKDDIHVEAMNEARSPPSAANEAATAGGECRENGGRRRLRRHVGHDLEV